MPALSSTAASAAVCSSAVKTGLRTSRAQIGTLANQRVETIEIGLDRVDRALLQAPARTARVA